MSGAQDNSPGFINLHVHSAYSLLEGALPIKTLLDVAVKDAQPAIAITDSNNLFGALEFSVKATDAGIQPIIGCQLTIDMDDPVGQNQLSPREHLHQYPSIVLLALSQKGYANLVELLSRAYLQGHDDQAIHIKLSWFEGKSDGLIALSGGSKGPIDLALKDNSLTQAEQRLNVLNRLFPKRFYIELQRFYGYNKAHETRLVELAYNNNIPLVATNEAFFPSEEDFDAHDALMAVAHNTVVSEENRCRLTKDHYLKNRSEMMKAFSDLPEALENSVEIARRCSFILDVVDPILPRFVGDDIEEGQSVAEVEADELRRQSIEGLKQRLKTHDPALDYREEDYHERLRVELDIIEKMKFPGYFLIVADFIKWAKYNHIPVGPGRGSGAGSLVAYALTITDVDPLRFSLLFERFLNPERVSMPDFDIDFCQDRREEVIKYVQGKYGSEHVAQIITFGSLQARAALRDVGRVLQMPYGQVDRICKLVPNNPAHPTPLHKAIEDDPKFAEAIKDDPVVGRLLDIAQKLEGLYRHASTHAAGIVIGDRPLWQLVPMYRDGRSDMPVTQFNMKWVEQAGLVKFDFLGLKTLTVIKTVIDFIAQSGLHIDINTIPFDDKKPYEMMSRGETVGVFQVESSGMRKALIGMKPDRIEDIIALVALYRPGPMENIPIYNARKHGEEELVSIHPKIDYLIEETQGVIVYQEQVMQIAQVLSGYSLGEADILRRAMGKKNQAEMDEQRVRFVDGAVERGVLKAQADMIFDLLAKFANYGFNKSHAAAYGIVSYQTAYLKAHYPIEFLAASMTLDIGNTEKLVDFRQDALRLGICVVAPSIQTSFRHFQHGDNQIYYSLAAIKGVGEAAVDHIVEARGSKAFKSIEDFCKRVDPKMINKRGLESLICAGAFDCFGRNRSELFSGLERISGFSQKAFADQASGQSDIFGLDVEGSGEVIQFNKVPTWLPAEKLQREYQVLGFYLSAHPLDAYDQILTNKRVQKWSDFEKSVKAGAKAGRLAGTVTGLQQRRTKKGNKMGIVTFSDSSGQFEAVLFSEELQHYQDLLEPGMSVTFTVRAEDRPEGVGLRVQSVESLEHLSSKTQKFMRIFMRSSSALDDVSTHLKMEGEGQVSFILIKDDGRQEIEIELPHHYQISHEIAAAMKSIPSVINVELV